MTKTKTTVLVVAVLLLVAAAVIIKLVFFPSIKDVWFTMNRRSLQQVPANLVVIRPTHFAGSPRKGIFYAISQQNGSNVQRMMGRNVPLLDVIAAAYSHNPARVALPPDAPKGNYDFLVTVTEKPEGHLQSAIRRKLGYTAQLETHDTPVLALKVEDANSPGLTVSSDDEKESEDMKDGKLYFKHTRVSILTGGLEQGLKEPVVDETGLTNFYDFSLVWDQQTQQMLRTGSFDLEAVKKILDGWGLGLEPDTASLEMLVVKRTD
jgi:uncharacterized protein (TIGR03435 family)